MAATDFLKIVPPKGKPSKTGVSYTQTFQPGSTTGVISTPEYRDHLTDIFNSRQTDDSRALIQLLRKTDPDVSAAFNAFLTMSDTDPIVVARAADRTIDREATKQTYAIIDALTTRYDYSLGFQLKQDFKALCADIRTMLLMRGAVAGEPVFDESMVARELRLVDPISLEWVEKQPGQYKPTQKVSGKDKPISLDLPQFFVSFFRRDPTTVYTESHFTSAINTIAARQQVINDLYRIMRITGFPRVDLKVVEEIIRKSAPMTVRNDDDEYKAYVAARIQEIASAFGNLRADQAFIHTDAVETGILNEKAPGVGIDITAVIETLNAQNQAGLKTMSTVIGRGDSGVNTASVESRIAAMNADQLNNPVAEFLSNIFTFLLNINGFDGFVDVTFRKVELRPELELEPQLTMRQSRLLQDLSHGIIDDDEYHLWMYGRIRPDSAPELSGTGFMSPPDPASVDATKQSPNADPLGRGMTSPDSKSAKSKTVKKPKA